MAKPGSSKRKLPVPVSTIVAFLIAVPVAYMAFNSYRKWAAGREKDAALDTEMDALRKRNAELETVYDAVQLKSYQICNKSADLITVLWLAAAFHDGKTVRVFDSDRCQDWKPLYVEPGGNKNVLLRSSQPGCNWDGKVMYYAMRYTAEQEEQDKYQLINVAGPYQGFDRDCFTIN